MSHSIDPLGICISIQTDVVDQQTDQQTDSRGQSSEIFQIMYNTSMVYGTTLASGDTVQHRIMMQEWFEKFSKHFYSFFPPHCENLSLLENIQATTDALFHEQNKTMTFFLCSSVRPIGTV